MKLGFNTNGLAFHRLPDALELLAESGYQAVALTLDHNWLDPYSPHLPAEIKQLRRLLQQFQLSVVVETGARFLLNPRQKHDPTLLSATEPERALRVDFLCRAIDIAHEIDADAVSFWSGTSRENLSEEQGLARLVEALAPVIQAAEKRNVRLAFEPEPGMFIDTMDRFQQLKERIASPLFGLTIDIGHLHCLKDGNISEQLISWREWLWNVHIEDMCSGVHEHLRFGEGEIDFPPIFQALHSIHYTGCVNVELSRHSHMAPDVLKESYEFLQPLISRAS